MARDKENLAGSWRICLDPAQKGYDGQWYRRTFSEHIQLPGTLDEAGYGIKQENVLLDRLNRIVTYTGAAWYQRDVIIPAEWTQKRLTLSLERTRPSTFWIDDVLVGTEQSLCTPHVYLLPPALTAGLHRLTILVDNSQQLPGGGSHLLSEDVQTNWNGILGAITLTATDLLWLADVQVFPRVEQRAITIRCTIRNATGKAARGALHASVQSQSRASVYEVLPMTLPWIIDSSETNVIEEILELGTEALFWDEFKPDLYRFVVDLEGQADESRCSDTCTVIFGLRSFVSAGKQFAINGRTTFLRGRHDAGVFPLTAYPSMQSEEWERVMSSAQAYGLNHIRFHSWCPPAAAFVAADRLGLYLQVELPNWANFGEEKHDAYQQREGERILTCYGNHPSFVLFSLGNEIQGDERSRVGMRELVASLRKLDTRHLYAQGSNNFFQDPRVAEEDDFWVTMQTAKATEQRAVRGTFALSDYVSAHIETRAPSTQVDYSTALSGVPLPVISHEVGQFQVYPDFTEIPRYTGVLRPRNLEAFRAHLQAQGMGDQAAAFHRASGVLATLCYREEIEAALRTADFAGFQLLDLQDYPGQGTALVGILDAFMQSKGLITPEAWREFCSPVVPLWRVAKYTWTQDETLSGQVQVAHYGPTDLHAATLSWTLRAEGSTISVAEGCWEKIDLPRGRLIDVGQLVQALAEYAAPQKYTLDLQIEGTRYQNHYPLWLYPRREEVEIPETIVIHRHLDDALRQDLAAGASVLLLPELATVTHSVQGAFQPDFWNFPMFQKIASNLGSPEAPGTLGLLCTPTHPALAHFLTEEYSNWQWWPLVKQSRPVILDETAPEYRPIIQIIDNIYRCHKLGTLFEARVGTGKVLICTIDLPALQNLPQARQLLQSLLLYMQSVYFAPDTAFPLNDLQRLIAG